MRIQLVCLAAAVLLAAGVITATPAAAATGPLNWNGATWCPTYPYPTWNGCNAIQRPSSYTVSLDPAQVTLAGNTWTLAMNQAATSSGSVTTQNQTTFPVGSSWAEQITVPCDSSGKIENWPAFWTVSANGVRQPADGEIDIFEGLSGRATWSVHYRNAAGQMARIYGTPAGNWCGTHVYAATWTAAMITIMWDGVLVGEVTPVQMGVPMFTDNQVLVNDYAAGSYGGPVVGGVSMIVGQAP
jgi:Glycosyl hydrolases family 16